MAEAKRKKINILFNEEYTLEFIAPKTSSEVKTFLESQHRWMHWKPISDISDEDDQFNVLLGIDVPSIIADLLTLDSFKETGNGTAMSKDHALLMSEINDLLEQNKKLKLKLSDIESKNLDKIEKIMEINESKLLKITQQYEEELNHTKKMADDTVAEFEEKYKKFANKAIDSVGILKTCSLLEYMEKIDQLQQDLIKSMQESLEKEKRIYDLADKLTKRENYESCIKNIFFEYIKKYEKLIAREMILKYLKKEYSSYYTGDIDAKTKELLEYLETPIAELVITDKLLYEKLSSIKDIEVIGVFSAEKLFSSKMFEGKLIMNNK